MWLILPDTFPLLAQAQKYQLKNNLNFSGSFFKIEASDEVIKSQLSSGHVYTCTGSATSTASSTRPSNLSLYIYISALLYIRGPTPPWCYDFCASISFFSCYILIVLLIPRAQTACTISLCAIAENGPSSYTFFTCILSPKLNITK